MHRSLPVSMCGGDLRGLHALTTPPRRWVDPPQGPLPQQSSVAWAVDLIHSVAPIQVAVGRKERLFLAIGCAPSRRRFAPPRAALLAPSLLLLGATVGAATFTDSRARAVRSAEPIAIASLPAAKVSLEAPSLLLAALRALRVEHDPQRARVLVAECLERHPSARAAEEALAVDIEAAVAHHDPDAAMVAAEYPILYPTGPFSRLAERTLAGVNAPPSRWRPAGSRRGRAKSW